MKTVKGLHEKMYTFDNANTSFKQAAKNKRFNEEVLAFSMSKEDELFRACEELENLNYKQGGLYHFQGMGAKGTPYYGVAVL